MRYTLYILMIFLIGKAGCLYAQLADSIPIRADTQIVAQKFVFLDSATVARNLFIKDSVLHIQDSLVMQFITAPEIARPNLFTEFLLKKYLVTDKYLLRASSYQRKIAFKYGLGQAKSGSKYWILLVILILLFSFSILRYYFTSEINLIFKAFYSTRAFNKINKETHMFSSWQFFILYIMFGFAAGLFLYLITKVLGNIYEYKDIELFIVLSGITVGCITLKILLLRLLGFVFHLQYQVRGYLNILYVTLFNTLFILLPLLLIAALVPHAIPLILISIAILAMIYLSTFIRVYLAVLSKHSFSKTYLILYLCTFEICPLIILIRALNIG